MELFASELVGEGPDGGPPYHLEFSDALGDCPRCGPRSCKAAILRRLRRPGDVVLVFGDGPSDLCPAREADLVFARGHLAERCAAGGARVAAAHATSATCSARSTRGWRAGERERAAPASGRSGADAGAGGAEPALLGPGLAARPARRRCSSSPPSPSRPSPGLFLIWLLRAGGPWYYFFDVSDIGVYLDYAQKVAAGQRVYKDFSFEYPPLALPLFTLPPHGDPAAYPNWFAAEMILLCSAAAALTGATAAALWRGLAAAARGRRRLRRRRARRRRDHRQPLRRGGGAHARRLPASSSRGATPPPPAPRSASAWRSSSRRACCCRWC